MSIRIVLADDHTLFAAGMAALLALEKDFEVEEICTSGSEALEAVQRLSPDVLIVDQMMGDLKGTDVAVRLRERGSETRLILLAATLNDQALMEAIRLDMPGILLKGTAAGSLVACIREVARGGRHREPALMERALELALALRNAPPDGAGHLTPREVEVLALVSQGLPNKQIAREVGVSEGTIKAHIHNLFHKLQVSSRTQLALKAREAAGDAAPVETPDA